MVHQTCDADAHTGERPERRKRILARAEWPAQGAVPFFVALNSASILTTYIDSAPSTDIVTMFAVSG